jgi:hypothetical protein
MSTNLKAFLQRTAIVMILAMFLSAVLPVAPAGATSLTITSVASGTWEATAWPSTLRSGTISVAAGNTTVTGNGTAFLTELSVGNILRTTGNIQVGTVASIASNTSLTLANVPATTRTNIPYHVQGVGPADNAIIDATHTVTIAAKPVTQTGTVTVKAGGTLNVSNAATLFSTLTVNGILNGTSGGNLGALTINNGGVVNAGTAGSYNADSLLLKNGGALNITRAFTVSGAATIAGTINFGSTTATARAMTFGGPVNLQSGAAWNEPTSGNGANNPYEFQHNFTNNASSFVTSNTSVHTFSGAGKALNGSTDTAIGRVKITGTYTNNGSLSAGINLTGAGSLTNSASGTLNVGGNVSITTLTNAGTMTKSGAGPITTSLANFTNTSTLNLNGSGTIAGITNSTGGTVNLNSSGLVTSFDNATATSTLNIFDLTPVPHFTNLIVTAPGNTVDYAGAGAQTVKPVIYSNLIFSGSGDKSITMPNGSTLTTGILSIAPTGTAKADITGPNLVVNSLQLGGFGKINGTWGSTNSAAANKDDNFFSTVHTGYLNVTTDSRIAQTITFTSSAPTDAAPGGTYTPTATGGGSGNPVTLTIDASAASVCSIAGGDVSFDAIGTCIINANQAGNDNYQPALQAQQSFAIKNSQTINFTSTAPSNAEVGGPTYIPTATATSGLPVTFTIDLSADSVCSIDAGEVSFESPGTCVINANQAGDATYHPAPQEQQSFAVTGPVPNVSVHIGPQEMIGSPFTLDYGASVRKSFPGVNKGPVKIEGNVKIFGSERVIYKINNTPVSFSEMMALPANQVDNAYWLPWYNNKTLDTQIRFANVGGAEATIQVTIGGNDMGSFTLADGASIRKTFGKIDKGPVEIVSNVDIVVSERVMNIVNGATTSFSEMMALPANQVDNVYWLPWYNSKTLDTQIRVANVSSSEATVHVFIAGNEVTGSPFTVPVDGAVRKTFPNFDKGPVKIESNVDVVVSERVIAKVNGTPRSFSEMMALPEMALDTTYWLPWYNSKTLETQIRIGNAGVSQATVHVYIGSVEVTGSPFTIPVDGSIRKIFAKLDKGPVKIVSNVDVVVSERVVTKVNNVSTSFSEMMALPKDALDILYWVPWYNNKELDTQLRFGVP